MVKVFISLVLIVYCLMILAHAYAPVNDDGEGAKIKFNKETHDFSEVQAGAIVDYVFKLKNVGDEVLKIHKVKGS